MAAQSWILIQNTTLLTMDPDLGIKTEADILIADDTIRTIGSNIPSPEPSKTEIIDGTDCIITPGFVNGHQHMWQQLIRAVATDWTLLDYFVHIRCKYGSLYTAEDVYYANYAAALNMLNNGVTCVLDHCHIMNSPQHSDAAVRGLKDAAIRGTFCYGWYGNPPDVEGGSVAENWDAKAREEDCVRVRKEHFGDNDPVTQVLTFGIAPNECQAVDAKVIADEIKLARKIGARIITNHVTMSNVDAEQKPIVQNLADANLLGPDLLFSHCNSCTDAEFEAMKAAGTTMVSTPDTELQMGMGWPAAFRAADKGCRAGLGMDITSDQGNDLVVQMRLLLQMQRARENGGKYTRDITRKTADVLKIATIGGAAAMRLDSITGSLTVGKKADLVVFKCDDINTVPYVDPVGEVVFHTSPQNIDTVIVNGKIAKRNGKLVGVDWPKLRQELRSRCDRIAQAAASIDTLGAEDFWTPYFAAMEWDPKKESATAYRPGVH